MSTPSSQLSPGVSTELPGTGRHPAPLALLFLVFLALGLALSFRSLGYDWFYDDLHLVRVYSPAELASVWTDSWDVDHTETPGFRPLTTAFNDVRARLFGESVVAHRLFLIALYSLCLTLFARVLLTVGVPYWTALAAGVLTIAATNSAYHFVWISDGVHITQGVTFALSAIALLSFTRRPTGRGYPLLLSLAFASICLLIREDSLVVFPILWLLAAVYWLSPAGRSTHLPERVKWLIVYGLGLAAIALLFWAWRSTLPLPPTNLPSLKQIPLEVASLFVRTVRLGGNSDRTLFYALFVAATILTACFPLVYLASKARSLKKDCLLHGHCSSGGSLASPCRPLADAAKLWMRSLALLGCMVVSSLPGVIVVRDNVTFFGTYFYAVYLGLVAATYLSALGNRRAYIPSCIGLIALFSGVVAISARNSMLLQESMHPYSIQSIYHNSKYLYGYGHHIADTVPTARREAQRIRLASLGFNASTPREVTVARIYCDALSAGAYHPTSDSTPFVPVMPFLGDLGLEPPPVCPSAEPIRR